MFTKGVEDSRRLAPRGVSCMDFSVSAWRGQGVCLEVKFVSGMTVQGTTGKREGSEA
jgi:hypothetical protein